MLVDKLNKHGANASYIGVSSAVHEALKDKVLDGEVTLFMGAGDMDKSYVKLFDALNAKN